MISKMNIPDSLSPPIHTTFIAEEIRIYLDVGLHRSVIENFSLNLAHIRQDSVRRFTCKKGGDLASPITVFNS